MLRTLYLRFKWWRWQVPDKFWMWVAWMLPKELVSMAYIRVVAKATTGDLSSVPVPDVRAMDAIEVWRKQN